MSIFGYPIEETVGGHFFTKISIPINLKEYKESVGDALKYTVRTPPFHFPGQTPPSAAFLHFLPHGKTEGEGRGREV